MSTPKKPLQVGIICGSTRTPRVAPQITQFVHDTIQAHLDAHPRRASVHLEVVDIAAFHLPLFDEPGIPRAITDPRQYAHSHTRTWSARISALDAFVLVTPQYNWGIPAALKNALDFLYHEWTGKPAMVVSYGGHGGGRAAEALRVVCMGLRMRVAGDASSVVTLAFPDDEFRERCLQGRDLGLSGEWRWKWTEERERIVAVWEDMARKFETGATS